MVLSIKDAIQIAEENIGNICTVQEWATEMGYKNTNYFSLKFRNHFGRRPKETLCQLKVRYFFNLINKHPEYSCYEIAVEIGFIDEKALNKFIKQYTGKPPNAWKIGSKKR